MNILPTAISGCFQLVPKILRDERGKFVKVFHEDIFREHGLETNFTEAYYSLSCQRVLRGLHFQIPPKDHAKLMYCVQGAVLDVVLDIRYGSPSYGEHIMLELNADTGSMLYLPKGVAHGFYTLSEQALMVYNVTTTYSQPHDTGILWDSAGICWPDSEPILSERDRQFSPLAEFVSPFTYTG
ncbi:MAG: dTDP-4-dehydrorhamnose 3,5-epimerase [Candidatus Saccharimonadales bacterium]